MAKTTHVSRPGRFWTFVLVSSLFVPAFELGAQTVQRTPTPTTETLKMKVKVVEVVKTGSTITVNPVKVKVKRKQEIVVWVTNGVSLKVEFKKSNPPPVNPFTDLVCKGRFCAALTPPDAVGIFNYNVTVDGVLLDPNVEVIP
ncbi:MAG: hypothetical protein M3542_09985 [Acidobacteriota bacterium]|nr:hypothetical protein [Acidobacteriota bacterium]MDQ5870927.1 hypothetical protein [Acidobacteriota bacterium]